MLLIAPQEPWFTGKINGVPFGTWCPAAIIILAISTDLLSHWQLPTVIQVPCRALSAPFRPFLTLHDIEGPVDHNVPQKPCIHRTLLSIALLSSVVWLAYLAYVLFLNEAWTEPLVASTAWVGELYALLYQVHTLMLIVTVLYDPGAPD